MKDGYIRVASASIDTLIGNVKHNANEIKNQEIIKVFYQNATSNSLLVKKEINEANETFKNVSSVLNNKKNAIARLVEINKV